MEKSLPKSYSFIFASIMSFLMSGIMTFAITFYQLGLRWEVVVDCLEAWKFAFPFAFVTAQVITPWVRKSALKISLFISKGYLDSKNSGF